VVVLLVAIAFVACVVPARKPLRIDVVSALRAE
jgi:ABC-type lipoprotein release transport system permease subunit